MVEPHVDAQDGRGQQEVYVVLTGAAEFAIDGQRFEATPGTLVRVDPEVHREARALQPHTTVLALGGESCFEPSASEWIERARPYIRSDRDRARSIIEDLRTQLPNSRGGDVADALLAVGAGNETEARRIIDGLLREIPDIRVALELDPDLKHLIAG